MKAPYASFRINLLLFLTGLMVVFGCSHTAQAVTGRYHLAMLHVKYSNTTAIYTPTQIQQAAAEITGYYANLSYGQLDLVVKTFEVTLPNPTTYYTACTATMGHPCPILIADAAEAAAAAGFDFTGIDGISVISTYCSRDFTFPPATINRTHVKGTFMQSHDYECRGLSPGPSGVKWGGWAHEIGHQIEYTNYGSAAFSWGDGGHPSDYHSGYDQMDSCYPCHTTAFSLLDGSLVTGDKHVFGDWMKTRNVAIVQAPSAGTTVVLTPIEQPFITTQANQAIQVPISSGIYYLVEARKRVLADSLRNPGVPPEGIYDEGVYISQITQSNDPPVVPINACDTTVTGGCVYNKTTDPRYASCNETTRPAYCWPYALWHVGDTYTDSPNGIAIKVESAVGDGFAVTVTRSIAPGHPNMFIIPWLSPPMNTYETEDIWVDSSCNGYESNVGPSGLLYGRRADGTVIGNGDDPCANHENRVYATVHNFGDQQANNIKVKFQVSNPLGVGVTNSWTQLAEQTIASLAAGASTTIYTTWTPNVDLTQAEIDSRHFAFHSCIQVIIEPVAGEIVTSDNQAQENFDSFAAVQTGRRRYEPIHGAFYVRRPDTHESPETYYLNVNSDLPTGWRYTVADGQTMFTLNKPGESVNVPVDIIVPPHARVGETYKLAVQALTQVTMTNDAIPADANVDPSHLGMAQMGGVVLSARAVLPSSLSLSAKANDRGEIIATGTLSPHRQTWVAVDFTDARGNLYTRLAQTDTKGDFICRFPSWLSDTHWKVRGLWQGSKDYSGAQSREKSVLTLRVPPKQPPGQTLANCAE